ncbi:MAG: IgGFc-binding protein, partial [Planctomycetes bacterium]|nr:IgGFc-binding protein [Planctomycetota bacterium]
MKLSSLLPAISMLALGVPAFAQNLDNSGTDFLCGFLPNYSNGDIELHISSVFSTNVTVEYPVNSPTFTTTVPVVPGTITTVALPATASQNWAADFVDNNMVRVTAPDEFTCYMINRAPFTSDAALALPVDTMNTEFIIADYDGTSRAQFLVYAQFDNTTVTITPTVNMQGHAAGTPFQVSLNAGEGYLGTATGLGVGTGLSGTLVESDRVIGVTNGNRCTNVPYGWGYCDHVFEVAQPVQTWGNEYLIANLPNRTGGDYYRVYASEDATDVFLDGVSSGIINRGEYLELGPLPGDHQIASSGGEPIFVAQFMSGSTTPGATQGDPAMGNMVSTPQFKSAYTFSTVGGAQFVQHYLTVIANDADLATITLDGAAIGAANFSAITGSGYSVARILIQEGTHATSSSQGHGITVEGYNQDDSYLFPGGALFQFINNAGDTNPPICTGVNFAASFSGTATDNRPTEDTNGNGILDAGEDLNGNGTIDADTGIFFVQLIPGSTNLDLNVTPFQPGDGTVTFTLSPTDPAMDGTGGARITDGAGNTHDCNVNFVGSIGTAVCDPIANSTG